MDGIGDFHTNISNYHYEALLNLGFVLLPVWKFPVMEINFSLHVIILYKMKI